MLPLFIISSLKFDYARKSCHFLNIIISTKKNIKPHKSNVISKTNKIEGTSQIYGTATTEMINKPICLFFVAIVKHRHVANILKHFVRVPGVNVED